MRIAITLITSSITRYSSRNTLIRARPAPGSFISLFPDHQHAPSGALHRVACCVGASGFNSPGSISETALRASSGAGAKSTHARRFPFDEWGTPDPDCREDLCDEGTSASPYHASNAAQSFPAPCSGPLTARITLLRSSGCSVISEFLFSDSDRFPRPRQFRCSESQGHRPPHDAPPSRILPVRKGSAPRTARSRSCPPVPRRSLPTFTCVRTEMHRPRRPPGP